MVVHTVKSNADFKKQLTAAGSKVVLIDFYATWCGPCKMIEPTVRALSRKYREKLVVLKVNVDKFDELAETYKVRGMPTFVFIKNGRRVSSFSGADDEKLTKKLGNMISVK